MSDAPAPSLLSRVPRWARRSVVGLVVLGAIVLACGVSVLVGRAQAASYDADWQAWKKRSVPVLQDAVKEPNDLYPRTGDELYDRKTQKAACERVATSRSEVRAAVRKAPRFGGGLGVLSGQAREGAKSSDRRVRVVRAFGRDAEAALTKVLRDCRWVVSIMRDPRAARAPVALRAADRLLEKKGASGNGYTCPTGRCVPFTPAKSKRHFSLLAEGYEARAGWFRSIFGGKGCATTSYAPFCAKIVAAQRPAGRATRTCVREARRATVAKDEAARQACNKVIDLREASREKLSRAFSARWPELRYRSLQSGIEIVDVPNRFLSFMVLEHLSASQDAAARSLEGL